MPDLSDDEIIAREKRKLRQAVVAGLIAGLALVGLSVVVWNLRPSALDKLLPFVPLVVMAAVFAAWYFFWRPAPEARTTRIMGKRMDEFQGRFRIYLMFMVIIIGEQLLNSPATSDFPEHGSFPPRAFTLVLLLLAGASLIAFGFGWLNQRFDTVRNDELAQALRFQVSRIGYLALMAGLCAAYLAFIYRPDLLSLVFRSALFAGIALPALVYIGLEWRAGRGG
jgi:hypothetical protein